MRTVPDMTSGTKDLTGVSLATARLVLREFRETDIDAITEACQDEEIRRYTQVPTPYLRVHAEKFVRDQCPARRAAGTDAVFGVFTADADDETFVGVVGLHNIARLDDPAGGGAGIGYWTAPQARRRGYTTEAVTEVCRWGLEDLGLVLIRWDAIVGNDGSLEVARRAGFVLEGTRRKHMVHRGVRKDMWVGSLLPEDFANRSR